MATTYGNGMPGMPGMEPPKASQACMTCRKQKRKCDKALPSCSLCERMKRTCDYSDTAPAPSNEDFNALRVRLMDLESRLNGGNSLLTPSATYATPSSTLTTAESLGQLAPTYNHPQEYVWQSLQNKFPAIAFLDRESFKTGGIAVPKPSLDIPVDVLELLGDAAAVQTIFYEYFLTFHIWMPIVSQKRLDRNMANPIWEPGPDLALLFLCMKLIISRPQDGVDCIHNPLYLSAKRFLALMEATGTISLLVLQAGLLIVWYEYGQAIYPAAWMSAGWCVRYGNLLGVNSQDPSTQMLGRPNTWVEQEERRRTWWGVLIADRIVSHGSQRYILTTQEPKETTLLPVNDTAWDGGDMSHAVEKPVATPIEEPLGPFPRLCQVSVMLGKVLHHHNEAIPLENTRFGQATQLYVEVSALTRLLREEALNERDYLVSATPLALAYSTLCALCDPYSCPSDGKAPVSAEASAMAVRAVDGLKSVSTSIIHFAEQINNSTPNPQDLDRLSPVIMAALYEAAANHAWMVRESGDENSQMALDSLRGCLGRLGTRWRNAAEYVRILEAKEFTYSVGGS